MDIDAENAEKTARALIVPPPQTDDPTAGGFKQHTSFAVDIASHDAVGELVKDLSARYARAPCVLVNSAGITRDDFMLTMEEKSFDDVISVNLKVIVLESKHLNFVKNHIKIELAVPEI